MAGGAARTFISPSKKARSSAYACAGLRRRVAELADGDADEAEVTGLAGGLTEVLRTLT